MDKPTNPVAVPAPAPTNISSMVAQPASTAQSTASALYDGADTIGRIRSYISIVMAHVILIPVMQVHLHVHHEWGAWRHHSRPLVAASPAVTDSIYPRCGGRPTRLWATPERCIL